MAVSENSNRKQKVFINSVTGNKLS